MPDQETLQRKFPWRKGDTEYKQMTVGGYHVNATIIHGDPRDLPKVLRDMTRAVNYRKPGTPAPPYEIEITYKGQTADELEEELKDLVI